MLKESIIILLELLSADCNRDLSEQKRLRKLASFYYLISYHGSLDRTEDTVCRERRGREGEARTDSVVASEESRVGALTQVEGASLAQLRLQLLPVSQRVGEFLEIFLCKY